jgi:hypothetical protein
VEVWIVIGGFAILFAAVITSLVRTNIRQKKRAKENPPAHKGPRQSQRGRVYRKGVTDHSAWKDTY